jgi:hypothetical protein
LWGGGLDLQTKIIISMLFFSYLEIIPLIKLRGGGVVKILKKRTLHESEETTNQGHTTRYVLNSYVVPLYCKE